MLNAMVVGRADWLRLRASYPGALLFFRHPSTGHLLAYDEDAWVVVLALAKLGWVVVPPFEPDGPSLPEGLALPAGTGEEPAIYVGQEEVGMRRIRALQEAGFCVVLLSVVG